MEEDYYKSDRQTDKEEKRTIHDCITNSTENALQADSNGAAQSE